MGSLPYAFVLVLQKRKLDREDHAVFKKYNITEEVD